MADVIVCGYLLRYPVAGMVYAYFQYVLGLCRLGHRVVYLEESGWPQSCYDPHRRCYSDDPAPGLAVLQALLAKHALDVPVVWIDRQSGATRGSDWSGIQELLRAADLLVNLGGVCWLPEFRLCRRRLLVDMDPFFLQIGKFAGDCLHEHHAHVSVGTNIGRPGCTIPDAGVRWLPHVPPVVPEAWPVLAPAPDRAPLTTIANWTAYGGATWRGEFYGQKDQEFERLLDLPARTKQPLEMALSAKSLEPHRMFRAAGWSIRDAAEVSNDLDVYQGYIHGSRGELSVAKHAYVKTRSGWLSDRSVCYLASGRPIVVQDTGFTDWLRLDGGILPFATVDEAAARIDELDADYGRHCIAARELAARLFDYRAVLSRLCAIGMAPDSRAAQAVLQ
jgi:hypothetical protein